VDDQFNAVHRKHKRLMTQFAQRNEAQVLNRNNNIVISCLQRIYKKFLSSLKKSATTLQFHKNIAKNNKNKQEYSDEEQISIVRQLKLWIALSGLFSAAFTCSGILTSSSWCHYSYKLAMLSYVFGKFFYYIFLFIRSKTITLPSANLNTLNKKKLMENVLLSITLLIPALAVVSAVFVHGNLENEAGVCALNIDGGLSLSILVIDIFLSSVYLILFLSQLNRIAAVIVPTPAVASLASVANLSPLHRPFDTSNNASAKLFLSENRTNEIEFIAMDMSKLNINATLHINPGKLLVNSTQPLQQRNKAKRNNMYRTQTSKPAPSPPSAQISTFKQARKNSADKPSASLTSINHERGKPAGRNDEVESGETKNSAEKYTVEICSIVEQENSSENSPVIMHKLSESGSNMRIGKDIRKLRRSLTEKELNKHLPFTTSSPNAAMEIQTQRTMYSGQISPSTNHSSVFNVLQTKAHSVQNSPLITSAQNGLTPLIIPTSYSSSIVPLGSDPVKASNTNGIDPIAEETRTSIINTIDTTVLTNNSSPYHLYPNATAASTFYSPKSQISNSENNEYITAGKRNSINHKDSISKQYNKPLSANCRGSLNRSHCDMNIPTNHLGAQHLINIPVSSSVPSSPRGSRTGTPTAGSVKRTLTEFNGANMSNKGLANSSQMYVELQRKHIILFTVTLISTSIVFALLIAAKRTDWSNWPVNSICALLLPIDCLVALISLIVITKKETKKHKPSIAAANVAPLNPRLIDKAIIKNKAILGPSVPKAFSGNFTSSNLGLSASSVPATPANNSFLAPPAETSVTTIDTIPMLQLNKPIKISKVKSHRYDNATSSSATKHATQMAVPGHISTASQDISL
jgi:hypothetical protein